MAGMSYVNAGYVLVLVDSERRNWTIAAIAHAACGVLCRRLCPAASSVARCENPGRRPAVTAKLTRVRCVNRPTHCAPAAGTMPVLSRLSAAFADRTPSLAPSEFPSLSPTLALACGCSRQPRLHRPLRFVLLPYLKNGRERRDPRVSNQSSPVNQRAKLRPCTVADAFWQKRERMRNGA